MTLRRKPNFYCYTVCLPTVIGIILTAVIFWIPATSISRFNITGLNLLIHLALLLHLGQQLGSTAILDSNVASAPRIGEKSIFLRYIPKYIVFLVRHLSVTALFISLSIVWSTIAYNLTNSKRGLPSFLSSFVYCATCCCRAFQSKPKNENSSVEGDGLNKDVDNDRGRPTWVDLTNVLDKLVFIVYVVLVLAIHI